MRYKMLVYGMLLLIFFYSVFPISGAYNIFKENSYNSTLSTLNQDYNDHIWPMYKQNSQHTGLCSYDTSENHGFEKWIYYIDYGSHSGLVIDMNEIIYTVSNGNELFAIYPNGSLKWVIELPTDFPYEPHIT